MKKQNVKKMVLAAFLLLGFAVLLYLVAPPVVNWVAFRYHNWKIRTNLEAKSALLAKTYYLDVHGDDKNDGLSPKSAWKTIDRINQIALNPGDSILLLGGSAFRGNLVLNASDAGLPQKPVTICSYGSGRAVIVAGEGSGIRVYNTQGIRISNLAISGSGMYRNKRSGIEIINDLWGNIKLPFVQVSGVEVSGFGVAGVLVDGKKGKSGFRNLLIENSSLHHNADAGLYVYGEYDLNSENYAHENIVVRKVRAYSNPGIPSSQVNTGSGIVLSDVKGGLIEYCVAYDNGAACTAKQGGPVGIWCWDADSLLIQYNESYANKTNCLKDGGGFDLDGGTTNSILQYNFSHDNEGSGLFLAQFSYARPNSGNIMRYNISVNDGLKNDYAGIDVWGHVENALVYNNTVVFAANKKSQSKGIWLRPNLEWGAGGKNAPENLRLFNNIIYAKPEGILVLNEVPNPSMLLARNNYYAESGPPVIIWSGKRFTSLQQWSAQTKQEVQNGSTAWLSIDPGFFQRQQLSQVVQVSAAANTRQFLLVPGSGLVDAGIAVSTLPGVPPASTDFHGVPLVQGRAPDLGATETIIGPNKNDP